MRDYPQQVCTRMRNCIGSVIEGSYLLTYAFQKKLKNIQTDQRQLPTRAHEGVRLEVLKVENVKFDRSINYRAHEAWNNMEVPVMLVNSKKTFKKTVEESFANSYVKP